MIFVIIHLEVPSLFFFFYAALDCKIYVYTSSVGFMSDHCNSDLLLNTSGRVVPHSAGLRNVRLLLAQNSRLLANDALRTSGQRFVHSKNFLCPKISLWQGNTKLWCQKWGFTILRALKSSLTHTRPPSAYIALTGLQEGGRFNYGPSNAELSHSPVSLSDFPTSNT